MTRSGAPFSEALKHAVLIIGAIIVFLPFYVMVSYSLKSPGEIERNEGGFIGAQAPMIDERCAKRGEPERDEIAAAMPQFPGLSEGEVHARLMEQVNATCMTTPVVFNYKMAFQEAPLLRYLLNGVIVTLSIFLIQWLSPCPAPMPCPSCAGGAGKRSSAWCFSAC